MALANLMWDKMSKTHRSKYIVFISGPIVELNKINYWHRGRNWGFGAFLLTRGKKSLVKIPTTKCRETSHLSSLSPSCSYCVSHSSYYQLLKYSEHYILIM